jgi:hypothetical protein
MERKIIIKRVAMEMFFILLPVMGIIVAIFATFIINGHGPEKEYVGLAGIVCLIAPFFSLQFFMPAKILDDEFNIDTNIPIWGKLVFYIFLFPFCDIFLVSALEVFLEILPEVERTSIIALSAIMYVVMISLGLIYNKVKKRKRKK